jgi:AraC family transcriptional regulator
VNSYGYFGDRIAAAARARRSEAFVSRNNNKPAMAFTHSVFADDPSPEIVVLPREEAFVFTLSIRGGIERELFLDGHAKPKDTPVPERSFSFHDLRREAGLRLNSRCENFQFYVPRECIDSVSNEAGRVRLDGFRLTSGEVVMDPIMHNVAAAILPSIMRSEQVSQVFIDHMAYATAAHVASTYGGIQAARLIRGGLAPWQERRAKEMLAADLKGSISLEQVAAQCDLSVGHFSRAFRKSTGVAPHQWLQQRRVDEAMAMLQSSKLSLAEIALCCGFSDQSHFTRVVTQIMGVSPGAWRKQNLVVNAQQPEWG